MKHTTPFAISALLSTLILAACATSQPPPPALVEARSTVRSAELDAAVQTQAPLELKKATDSLNRANMLLDKGESMADVSSAAYIASQQAKTAMAIAKAKGSDTAMSTAELERERARSEMREAEAQRARAQTGAARQQTAIAEQRASGAEQRAAGAEQQAAVAQATASEAQQQAAQLRQRLADLQAKQTERGMLVTLGDVLFESGRAEVKPGAQASLGKLADFLKQYPTRHILIEGHTDNVGAASYNEALSQRRAAAVQTALLSMGVASNRVTTAGYGKDYPVAGNNTDTDRALNRRVEVYIADNDMPVKSRR
ncbi:MAG: OmpA family protein [Cytophagales bacterium]|nr:OmpA family protein [Rhizobacter sp.]